MKSFNRNNSRRLTDRCLWFPGRSVQSTHQASHSLVLFIATFVIGLIPVTAMSQQKTDAKKDETKLRTLFVPFEDLDILFDGSSQHVYLDKAEYEELIRKSRKRPVEKAPRSRVYASAIHSVDIVGQLAKVQTEMKIETLESGLHAIAIPFQGMHLQSAKDQNGTPLPMGKNSNGQTIAFLEGKKTHELRLEFVSVVKLETAKQSVQFQLPPASVSSLNVTVNGNVELASGAAVVKRTYDQPSNRTRFQLVGSRDKLNLVMSVNNKKLQEKRAILAKSVFIHELTSNYEQIHARVNVDILYGATEDVRFQLPDDFQITEVTCGEMANWSVEKKEGNSFLVVRLRESVRKSFALNIAATSTRIAPNAWKLQPLKPIDFSGSVSVIGVVAEERFQLESLNVTGLFAIDNSRIRSSIPETVFKTTAGAPAIATVAAFYAPDKDYSLQAQFATPPALLKTNPTSILFLSDRNQKLIGQYQLTAQHEKVISFDLKVPAGWRVNNVKGEDGKPIPFQRNKSDAGTSLNIRIPGGITAGSTRSIVFEAMNSSQEWTGRWEKTDIDYPRFDIAGSVFDKGAIAVVVEDDLVVHPRETKSLESLLKDQKSLFGLEGFNTSLTFEIIDDQYSAKLNVERLQPTITATAYNFFRLMNQQIAVNYEIAFDIRSARARKLEFSLPKSTPVELNVRGIDGIRISQFDSSEDADGRTWTVELAEPSLGEIRIAVNFLQPLANEEVKDFKLPLVKARSVGYQTSLVAFEGNPDFDVDLQTEMRTIDVGEMGDAQFVPGSRLLGAYSATDNSSQLAIDVARRNIHQLPTAIVQSASIKTLVAKNGQSQSIAAYDLLTKSPFIELKLPATAKLWAAQLDGVPTRPQVRNDSILISLPPDSNRESRQLTILYEDQISSVGLAGKVKLSAPELLLINNGQSSRLNVPQADLKWQVTLPSGYTITSNDGTVFTTREERRPLPFETVSRSLFGFLEAKIQADRARVNASLKKSEAAEKIMAYNSLEREMPNQAYDGDLPFGDANKNKELARRSEMDALEPDLSDEKKRDERITAESLEGRLTGMDSKTEKASGKKVKGKDGKLSLKKWFNKGIAGLTVSEMNLDLGNETSTFQLESLGSQANVSITIVDEDRINWLAFAYGGLVIGFGLFLSRFSWKLKLLYLMAVVMIAAIVPMMGDWTQILWGGLENSLYACCLLIVLYVIHAIFSFLFKVLWKDLRKFFRWILGMPSSQTTAGVIAVLCCAASQFAAAQEKKAAPVEIPQDAIIVPYDPSNPDKESDQIFVPYARYMELLKIVDPSKVEPPQLPAEFGWSSARYEATLNGSELIVKGKLDLECFSDAKVSIPLFFEQAVLTQALLDKKPAQLKVVAPTQVPQKQAKKQQAPAVPAPAMLLFAEGRGKKSLEIELKLKVNQVGGWRQIAARLPMAPAARMELKLPEEGSELNYRIGNQTVKFISEANKNTAIFPLASDGRVNWSWRGKITVSKVDQNLSLNSTALFDVRNDGLHLVWNMDFLFRGSKRNSFEVELPKDFSVVRVDGQNVRGWDIREEPQVRILEVALLSEADSKESFSVELSNRNLDLSQATSFPMPAVVIPDAAIHSGQITVRKSDLLDLQTDTMIGISRIDVSEARQVKPKSEPLFNPAVFQAFEFSRTPYSVAIRCRPKPKGIEVRTRSLVDIREKSCGLDLQVNLSSARPLHELTFELPLELNIQKVLVPSPFRKSISKNETTQILKLFLASGLKGEFAINISGRLPDHEAKGQIPLPRIGVKGATSHTGEISAIAEPQLIVEPEALNNCESVLLSAVNAWLNQRNRSLARVAILHKSADYSGALKITRKNPIVTATSVSNVNVTLRSIEESVMVSFDIRDAGVDRLEFRIPSELKNARIRADLVREQTVEPAGDADTATEYKVTLQLQDNVIGQYRVLLEQDRGLSAAKLNAPIPSFGDDLAQVERFVTVQNSGFDELLVKDSEGLEKLDRRQKPFRDLKNLVGGADIRQGYVVNADEKNPKLSYQTNPRQLVETVGASIGLSEIEMTVDRSGGYRAEQKLYLDNRTEPFLEIEMPADSRLWTVQVAGDPVKPIAIEGDKSAVRIPLIKTADGDSDFLVSIKYGGSLGRLKNLSKLNFPFTKTRNIRVSSSNVKLNLPEDFDFWWFEGTLGVSEEKRIEQAKSAYQTALFSKLKLQASKSKSELVRQRAAQNLTLLNGQYLDDDVQYTSPSETPVQVDNRARFNSVYEGQRLELFGNSGNVANEYGGNFGKPADGGQSGQGQRRAQVEFNDKWFDSNGLVNPKVAEQNKLNQRFNAPGFVTKPQPAKPGGKGGMGGGGGFGGKAQFYRQQAQEEFKKQITDNINVLQEQSQKARRGGNKKDAILRKYQSQLRNRGNAMNQTVDAPQLFDPANDPDANANAAAGAAGRPASDPFAAGDDEEAQVGAGPAAMQTRSLNVEFNHRGKTILFQAPSGELKLQATVVSKSLQRRSVNFLVLFGFVSVCGCLVWFFGSRNSRAN